MTTTDSSTSSSSDAVQAPAPTPLQGTTVLVTGGGRGLGATISRRLAVAGARVAITGRNEAALAAWAEQLPNDPVVLTADMADPEAPRALLDRAVEALGSVDVLVNNAGIGHFGASDALTAQDVDALLAVNLRAPLLLAAAAAAHMAGRGGGSVVNITSGLGETGGAGSVLYGASKGGLDAATRALAAEWGPRHVRVNGVRVSLIRTDASAALLDDDDVREGYVSTIPLGRLGTVDDIAEAVLFLAAPASVFVTGQVLNVDGGTSTTAPSPFARG